MSRAISTIDDLTVDEITKVFSLSAELRYNSKKFAKTLEGKTVMVEDDIPSFLKTAITAGVATLGGSVTASKTPVHTTHANVMAQQVSAVFSKDVAVFAKSSAGVSAGVTPTAAPLAVLADLYTMIECLNTLKGLNVAIVGPCACGYAADMARASAKMGFSVKYVCACEGAPAVAATVVKDVSEGVKGADVIYLLPGAAPITAETVALAKPTVIVLAPEVAATEVDESVFGHLRCFIEKESAMLRLVTMSYLMLITKANIPAHEGGMRLLVALGGNALIQPGQKGSEAVQFANARIASEQLAQLVEQGCQLVITHGNGPQVGALLLQNDLAKEQVPDMPLYVCGAESQGLIGFMMVQEMRRALRQRQLREPPIACVVTQTIVSESDPAFQNPTKPVGRFYTAEEAEELKAKGYTVKEDSGRGYRMVVPSPQPLDIVEWESVRALLDAGGLVVSCGGGGIPCLEDEHGNLKGVPAVIDKDLCGEVLAKVCAVDHYCILTDVDSVFINYNKPNQKSLDRITVAQAREYLANGEFGKGSMGPKVDAACRFAEKTGRAAIITSLNKCVDAVKGLAGTHIIP